jgi:hypothetical protein
MEYTPLENAFNQHCISIKGQNTFSNLCVYCSSPNTMPLLNELRQCNQCRKQFKARPLTSPTILVEPLYKTIVRDSTGKIVYPSFQ